MNTYEICLPVGVGAKYLRKYTSLPILIDMLMKKKFTLTNPNYWEDKNDTFFIEKYRELRNLGSVLVSCFSTKPETFHHWKIFSGNSGGVCVRFETNSFLQNFEKKGVRADDVKYKMINELKKELPSVRELPFIKRKQYEDECEYRIIYENTKGSDTKEFDFKIGNISRIILNPWIPKPISENVKKIIRSIPDCAEIEILRTGVIENETWKNIANRLR